MSFFSSCFPHPLSSPEVAIVYRRFFHELASRNYVPFLAREIFFIKISIITAMTNEIKTKCQDERCSVSMCTLCVYYICNILYEDHWLFVGRPEVNYTDFSRPIKQLFLITHGTKYYILFYMGVHAHSTRSCILSLGFSLSLKLSQDLHLYPRPPTSNGLELLPLIS